MLSKTMKYNHLLLPVAFLTVSIWGCHSNNTPTPATTALAGRTKEGTCPTVYLPQFVRPNEIIIVQPVPTPTPFITMCLLSNGHMRYAITDDKGRRWPSSSGFFKLPAAYRGWTFDPSNFNPTSYKTEAQVTGSTGTLYTKCRKPYKGDENDPKNYKVGWSTTAP